MSGILNGESIYKYGAGGGYKNGGTLTPAEYINVPNNVIVEYDNNDDVINFVIEDDGKPHNSVIELTTTINSVVNVYEVKNGLCYLMGIIGPNTVLAGQDYTVNIIGNSYVIENVTVQSSTPAAGSIDGQIYGIVKIGNTYWTTSNIKTSLFSPMIFNNVYYYGSFGNIDGWRLPNIGEFQELTSVYGSYTDAVKSTSGWFGGGGNGTNASGLNFFPEGHIDPITLMPSDVGSEASFLYYDDYDNVNLMRIKFESYYVIAGALPSPVRLVKTAY